MKANDAKVKLCPDPVRPMTSRELAAVICSIIGGAVGSGTSVEDVGTVIDWMYQHRGELVAQFRALSPMSLHDLIAQTMAGLDGVIGPAGGDNDPF